MGLILHMHIVDDISQDEEKVAKLIGCLIVQMVM